MANIPEYLNLTFAEQLEYFLNKKVLPPEELEKIQGNIHDRAFTIKGLTQADLLQDIKDLLDNEIESAKGLDEFLANFNQLIQNKGWKPKGDRARTIYDTNTRRAHAAGRWRQQTQPEMLERNPYVVWRHRTPNPQFGGQPRPEHKALNGKVFSLDEMRRKKVYPPCAWGCRCTAFSISERQLKAMGKTVSPVPNPKTIVDKGFDRIPGSSMEEGAIVKQKKANLSPEIRKKVEVDVS